MSEGRGRNGIERDGLEGLSRPRIKMLAMALIEHV